MNTAILVILASLTQLSPITGRASVVDGDTIDIGTVRIRLNGVDAPESWQRCTVNGKQYQCGKAAAFALDDWLAIEPGINTGHCAARGVATCI